VRARVLESQRIGDTVENFIGAFIPPKIARIFQRFAASMRQPLPAYELSRNMKANNGDK
jgi:hypothetical protein